MQVLKGENLMLFVKKSDLTGITQDPDSWVCLGHASSHSLNLNVDALDISSKDSGSWAASMPSKKSWDFSADAFHTKDYDNMMRLAISRKVIEVLFCAAANTEAGNVVTHTPSAKPEGGDTFKFYKGNAWINSVSENAPNGDAATYSVSMTGTGALDQTDTLPGIGITTDINLLTIAQGSSATVNVLNYTGTLTTSCSDANTTATVSDGVVTISVGSTATAGGSYVTISDAGTGTSTIVYVTIVES